MNMKLILEIRRHGDDEDAQHLAFEKFPVGIGRGFDNDVILNDPYISAHHLHLEYDGETCIVNDYNSTNGFTLNGRAQPGRCTLVYSGDVLQVGHTEIRVYKTDHPVTAAELLPKDSPIFAWVAHPINVWACFLLAVAVTLCWAWLEIWADEEGLALAGAAAGTVSVIVIWSAIWSVAGRLARHKAHFKSHITMICLYMIAGTVAWYIEAYTDFLTNENWFSQIATYGINFVLLGYLLYGSFTLATKMRQKRRLVSAVFFSFGVMAGVFSFGLVSAKTFNQQPLYPATLEPYLSQLAPADTVDKFMADNGKLFSSHEFAQPVAAKNSLAKH